MNLNEKLQELEKKFGVSKEIIQAIELNLLEELEANKMLTNCTSNNSCDSSRCGPGQDCREFRYGTCYCTNN